MDKNKTEHQQDQSFDGIDTLVKEIDKLPEEVRKMVVDKISKSVGTNGDSGKAATVDSSASDATTPGEQQNPILAKLALEKMYGIELNDPDVNIVKYFEKELLSPALDRIKNLEGMLSQSMDLIRKDELKTLHERLDKVEKSHDSEKEKLTQKELIQGIIKGMFDGVNNRLDGIENGFTEFMKGLGVTKSAVDRYKYDYSHTEEEDGVGSGYFRASKKASSEKEEDTKA